MTRMRNIAEPLLEALRAAQSVVVCCHISPDGDTVGSALAMKQGLEQLGKQVSVVCQDKPPHALHILPQWECIATPESVTDRRFDLMLAVDVSDELRLGSCRALAERCGCTAQIDHHHANPLYCQINEVDGRAAATALLAKAVLDALGVEITGDIATCLYVGIATDTNNFMYPNTTDEAFLTAAELVRYRLPLARLNRELFLLKSRQQIELTRYALDSLVFLRGGEISVMKLTQSDFTRCGALQEHADTIVNMGIEIHGVKLTALARELGDGRVKVNLRAREPWRVDGVAAQFGGGGHPQAAACIMPMALADALEAVTGALETYACQMRAQENI